MKYCVCLSLPLLLIVFVQVVLAVVGPFHSNMPMSHVQKFNNFWPQITRGKTPRKPEENSPASQVHTYKNNNRKNYKKALTESKKNKKWKQVSGPARAVDVFCHSERWKLTHSCSCKQRKKRGEQIDINININKSFAGCGMRNSCTEN